MNHLSTHLGALELGHVVANLDDGTVETSARQAGPTPTHMFPHCISDGALEAAASTELGPSTIRRLANTMCIG